ncbi:GNAT family N-acetyltransferase [Mycobacterium deserti]|uniref:GNAT family N-acetyltransferase n=1 Tax=Mycobacterium deserti TaxID=2978347 RepID=A0ABT2MBW9_9MYCO|nr:GNAT family N-acetyltransferase [Mycobacterium deserti]MCT7659767.1 GNAT family N-acetyltransferase [Mycobacterium deserti]
MTVRIVRLTEKDWRLFATVRLRALTESLGENDPQFREEVTFTAARWRRRLRDHAQFAAVIGNRAVGLIGAQPQNTHTVYLYSLWLDPSARGLGLARQLVVAALDWAQRRHARTVRLRVAVDNTPARTVYESLGFSPSAESRNRRELAMTLNVN